ncbi:cation:proton antiporter [Pseudomonas sp. 17391]|uniref:cation:proton antiporter n=1 Tax=Pseudomonas sp. 17391 TaxID=2967217 RepID=UPI002363B39D|nr:cation:proton antiporter [Pseudomonas sp. 17391]MDD2128763.1 cation:proton antiporter [Pseudomonas sp. 17391]
MSKLIVVILVLVFVCVVCRRAVVALGQPRVLGDIVTGMLMGPAIFDAYLPSIAFHIGLPEFRGLLNALGELGLIIILVEVCWHGISRREGDLSNSKIALVAFFGVVTSFAVGGVLAFYSSEDMGLQHTLLGYILFCGVAFSVTALPVLVLLLDNIAIVEAKAGRVAVVAAVYTDIFVWCALAVILIVWGAGTGGGIALNLGVGLIYVATMLLVVRPKIMKSQLVAGLGDGVKVVVTFIIVLSSSQLTEFFGVHSSVGALLAAYVVGDVAGVKGAWDKYLLGIRQLVIPMFFIASGGMISVSGLSQMHIWFWLFVFLLGATISKIISCYIAGLLVGMRQRASMQLGILMSTKGTAELVVLAVGYREGLLSDDSYTVLLILSVASMMLTVPMLAFLNSYFGQHGGCPKG